jgi:hypothetical protein
MSPLLGTIVEDEEDQEGEDSCSSEEDSPEPYRGPPVLYQRDDDLFGSYGFARCIDKVCANLR